MGDFETEQYPRVSEGETNLRNEERIATVEQGERTISMRKRTFS